MYSYNILNFQESTTIFKWLYEKSLETYRIPHVFIQNNVQASEHTFLYFLVYLAR